jgi:hypothetical protein
MGHGGGEVSEHGGVGNEGGAVDSYGGVGNGEEAVSATEEWGMEERR